MPAPSQGNNFSDQDSVLQLELIQTFLSCVSNGALGSQKQEFTSIGNLDFHKIRRNPHGKKMSGRIPAQILFQSHTGSNRTVGFFGHCRLTITLSIATQSMPIIYSAGDRSHCYLGQILYTGNPYWWKTLHYQLKQGLPEDDVAVRTDIFSSIHRKQPREARPHSPRAVTLF